MNETPDLMAALRASLDAVRADRAKRAPQRQCRDHDDHGQHHYTDPLRGLVWSCQGRGPTSRGVRPDETKETA